LAEEKSKHVGLAQQNGCILVLAFFFQFSFSCCSKSDEHPQEDLAKSGYKTNREAEHLGTEPLEPRNLPKASQNLGNFKTSFLEM
jgi:hypothetical protein